MPKTEWSVQNQDTKSKKSLLEKLLEIRGFTKKADIDEFLNPLTMDLSLPDVFSDMQKALDRIVEAIDNKENILIYGDFDADGITSTSLLYKTFTELEANISYYIPDREADGHGLNSKALVKLMTQKKPKLIITVDCGVSNVEEVKFLKSFKVDCIITDHHEAPEILPEAVAIINPKAQNALSEKLSAKKIEHLTSLAGCGVAFKLAQALLIQYKKTPFINELLPFVAVGTVADIVPLIGENRYFVQKGIELIEGGKHYGLKRLLEVAGSAGEITSEKIAFTIAPRINACGRLDSVEDAVKLMISDNKQEIEMAIVSLNNFNKIRQDLCENTFLEADEMLEKEGNKDNAIILFNKDWHIGIIGIVASKLVEKYYKPTFLMTYSEETKQIRCSARSVKGIHLYDTICSVEELLDGFGGHEMAAGLYFSQEKASFETVKKALNKVIDESLASRKLVPQLNIDCELSPFDVELDLVQEIKKLEPFGAANEAPVFCMNNVILKQKTLMGENKNHLRLTVQKEGKEFTCVWWSHGDIPLMENDVLDVAFSPQINIYKGNTYLQLVLKDIHSEHLVEVEPEKEDELKVFDHRKKTDIYSQVNDYCKTSKLDIVVFAENKMVLDTLKPYKAISERIVSLNTLKNADSIMFFDYPTDEDSYNLILEKVMPKQIHYMYCEFSPIDEREILKTLFGMIKFVCNNKDGLFDLSSASSFLALNKNSLNLLMEILDEVEIIKILENKENILKIKLGEKTDLTLVLHSEKFKDFKNSLDEIEEFKQNLFEIVGS